MNTENISMVIKKEQATLPVEFTVLQQYFTPPEQKMVTTLGGNQIKLWQILKKDEYMIMYSDQRKIFGLAFNNIVNELIYLGGNGSLTEAIEALLSKEEE